MKARVLGRPVLHFGMLMGGVGIANQVKFPIRGEGVVDQAEKLEPLLVPMTLLGTAAIRSDLLARGQPTGSTRKTFMSSKLTACITCATRCTQALTLPSASTYSGCFLCGLCVRTLSAWVRQLELAPLRLSFVMGLTSN